MPKPKLNVTQVWILQRGTMYDTPTILNVHLDPQEAMNEHMDLGGWSYDEKQDFWATEGDHEYYLLTRHPILVTRKTKTAEPEDTLADAYEKGWQDRNVAGDRDGLSNPYR